MAIKVEGVLARPGEYTFQGTKERKTVEELKVIARDQGLIDISLGHPENRMIEKKHFLGSVKPFWSEEKNALLGSFWFKDEHLHKIPEELRRKIKTGQPVGISMGYMFEKEDGILKDMHLNHVALLQPDEKGICPLTECGVNVRMESEDTQFRYEQASEIPDPEAKEEATIEGKEPAPIEEAGFNATQLDQIRDLISGLMPAPPQAEPEPVVEEEPEPEATPEPTPPEPKVEPEVVIPAERGEPVSGSLKDGLSVQILGEEMNRRE
jgi:hypothetical protein